MPVASKMSGAGATANVTPRFKIEIDGTEVTHGATQGLESCYVEDHVGMIGIAEFTFSASGDGVSVDSFKAGQEIKVKFGDGEQGGGSASFQFAGIITGVRHSFSMSRETVSVKAMDPLCKLAGSRVTKTYEKQKDSDIVSAVLGEAGLEAGNIEATEEEFPFTIQRNESYYSFLMRLARRNGYLLRAIDGKVDFAKPNVSGSPVEFPRESIISFDYTMTDRGVPSKVNVRSWDYTKMEEIVGSAGAGDVETIGGGTSAADQTGQVFQTESWISDVPVQTQAAANQVAKAHMNAAASGFMSGRAVVEGTAAAQAGSIVKFKGPMGAFQPTAYVVSARTRIYNGEGTTELQFQSNTLADG